MTDAEFVQARDDLIEAIFAFRNEAEAEFGSNDKEHDLGVSLADAAQEFIDAERRR